MLEITQHETEEQTLYVFYHPAALPTGVTRCIIREVGQAFSGSGSRTELSKHCRSSRDRVDLSQVFWRTTQEEWWSPPIRPGSRGGSSTLISDRDGA